MEHREHGRLWMTTELLGVCLLYLLIQYVFSCWILSFQHHPLFILLFAGDLVMLDRFWSFLRGLLGRWPALAVLAGCLLFNILLVWAVGYFPVSTAPVRFS